MKARLYSLFIRKRGARKWERFYFGDRPAGALRKADAVRVYQNLLINYALMPGMEASLRVVK